MLKKAKIDALGDSSGLSTIILSGSSVYLPGFSFSAFSE
jgi:hypothetical protein